MYSSDGFHITELMYVMGLMDARVRPFISLVRRWAYEFKVTQSGSRDKFTNFQLTYMALCFLQHVKDPVLPTAAEIFNQHQINSNNAVERYASTFLFDINQIKFKTNNTSSIFELFIQFLEFYQAFDIGGNIITIGTTDIIQKTDPESSPLLLENIFDSASSWGGNVSEGECNTFKLLAKETLLELTNKDFSKTRKNEKWGLLELCSHLEDK